MKNSNEADKGDPHDRWGIIFDGACSIWYSGIWTEIGIREEVRHVDFWERTCGVGAASSMFPSQVFPYAWSFHGASQEVHGSGVE